MIACVQFVVPHRFGRSIGMRPSTPEAALAAIVRKLGVTNASALIQLRGGGWRLDYFDGGGARLSATFVLLRGQADVTATGTW
jgi:hypothetical protein